MKTEMIHQERNEQWDLKTKAPLCPSDCRKTTGCFSALQWSSSWTHLKEYFSNSPTSSQSVEICATEILIAKWLAILLKLRLRHIEVLREEMRVHCFTQVFQSSILLLKKSSPKFCALKGVYICEVLKAHFWGHTYLISIAA